MKSNTPCYLYYYHLEKQKKQSLKHQNGASQISFNELIVTLFVNKLHNKTT